MMHMRFIVVAVAMLLYCGAAGAQDAQPAADAWSVFATQAAAKFGEAGARAAAFLKANHPGRDETVDSELLMENLELALKARETFPWAKRLSDELFFNDVLPYAIIDETRERWRPELFDIANEIVKDATTAADAAQVLNRDLFKKVNVKYSTARPKANQSPRESMKCGLASCTGLSILLADACRAVGVPARLAGIASWPDREGNHTWVEIWDGERWCYTGAAEYDAGGLDRAWFSGPASHAVAGHQLHAIWATSFRATDNHFLLAWDLNDHSIPAVDVTTRYAAASNNDSTAKPVLAVRLWASRGGTRMAAQVKGECEGQTHVATTFADPDDINRVAELPCDPHQPHRLELKVGDETRLAWVDAAPAANRIVELYWDELSLSKAAAEAAAGRAWRKYVAAHRKERKAELDAMTLHDGEFEMKLLRKDFGDAPRGGAGHSLWISMHGGGGAPAEVNDQQWQNQIKLYQLPEGIYIAPRAPSNEWNLWHRSEIDRLFSRLIESAIIAWDVDPDRVYLMGYSAGGDGVYQLGPRMADRFAAAAMMAGHPNDSSPLGLRNLPFAIFAGGKDAAYNRNTVAAEWGRKLDELHESDAQGYPHMVRIYPECGHWMNGKDAEAVPWMAAQKRNAWPRRIVWHQGNTPHTRFYWLSVAESDAVRGRTIIAEVKDQTIALQCKDRCEVELLLRDELIDLDQPIRVTANDKTVFEGRVIRSKSAIEQSLAERADPRCIATARVKVVVEAAERK